MIGRTNTGSGGAGGKSIILPSSPIITNTTRDKTTLTVTWTQPTTEVEVKQYNIYILESQPTALKQMRKVGTTTNKSYTITGLTKDTLYYIAIESVGINGYENASLWQVRSEKTYGDAALMFVGYNGSSGYSSNRTSWTSVSGLDSSTVYFAVAYGKNMWFTISKVSNNLISYYSKNNLTWVALGTVSGLSYISSIQNIMYANGYFITLAPRSNVSPYTVMLYTTDPSREINYKYSQDSIMSVTQTLQYASIYIDNKYIIGSNGYKVYYSTDPINNEQWVAMSVPSSVNTYDTPRGFAYGDGKLYMSGGNSQSGKRQNCYYTTDFKSWTLLQTPTMNTAQYRCAYGKNKLLLMSDYGLYSSYYKNDSSTEWIAIGGGDATRYVNSIIYNQDRFIIVGSNGSNSSSYSYDGITWVTMTSSPNQQLQCVAGKE